MTSWPVSAVGSQHHGGKLTRKGKVAGELTGAQAWELSCPAGRTTESYQTRLSTTYMDRKKKKKEKTLKKNPYLYILTAISLLLVAATLVGCFLQTPGGRAAV